MDRSEYLHQLSKVESRTEEAFADFPDIATELYFDFLRCKANLKSFLPEYAVQDYSAFYRKMILYRNLAEADQTLPYATDSVIVKGIEYLDNSRPNIFCTFHMGSYRLINGELIKKKIPHAFMIRKAIFNKEERTFYRIINEFQKRKKLNVNIKVLDAEDERIAFQMIREIRNNSSILAYIDGNTGVGSKTEENLAEINFLGKQILVRKGVSFISYVTKAPIIPVVSYRTSHSEPVIEFSPPIWPEPNMSREDFSSYSLQILYNHLAKFVHLYPEQWECWMYMDNWLPVSPTVEREEGKVFNWSSPLKFNAEQFCPFVRDNTMFLFNLDTCDCIKISNGLHQLIKQIDAAKVSGTDLLGVLKKELLQSLVDKRVLIA